MKGTPAIINKYGTDPFAPIELVPVFMDRNGRKVDVNQFAVVNSENDAVYGVVSEDYELIHNHEVNEIFETAFADVEVLEIHDHMDFLGRRWKRRFIISPEQYGWEIGESDDITGIMLEVFNGYTGKNSYGYSLMGFRWICANGMVMGKKPIFSSTFTHLTNALETIRQGFSRKLEAFEENILLWKQWEQISFPIIEMNRYLESKSYVSDKGRERILETYDEVLNREHLNDTKWGAFNALTFMSTHKISTRKEGASPIFSNSANVLTRLADEFYEI